MTTLRELAGLEVLDSRGRPTVLARCTLDDGTLAAASVPSGASTGASEAHELRDGDPARYRGKGCRTAARHISGPIHDALSGRDFPDQAAFDHALIELDGTEHKQRLGANAILACSVAFARAVAMQQGRPLYAHLATLLEADIECFPRLTINLLSGGKHAGQQVAIQDVLIVPASPTSIDGQLVMMGEIYACAAELILERHGMRLLTADEGGLGPPVDTTEQMLQTAIDAIEKTGLKPGHDAALAVDIASTHFYEPNSGLYRIEPEALSAEAMIERVATWCGTYPIVSVEDGLAEDDWSHWPQLCERVAPRALVLGDDLLCTNPQRIRRAIAEQSCNALLLKVNQIGTLTEAAEAYRLAAEAGWMVTISVRSGETEDDWAADLVVGWQGDQFKNGSVTQSERLAKYNRLLAIEAERPMPVVDWPNRPKS